MRIAFFDTHEFEKDVFLKINEKYNFSIDFLNTKLTLQTALLAQGSEVVCSFVQDDLGADCISCLKKNGVKLIVLRSAGFNHVDIKAAQDAGILVARVPSYSPHAVAEFAIGLLLTLNRKIHKATARVKELNFSLDGLVGFDLNGKTVGVIGTGKIGSIFAQIMSAFGCHVLATDLQKNSLLEKNTHITYTDLNTLYAKSDVISLHVPLTPATHHVLGQSAISLMKKGVYIVNTGRGALIDTKALIAGLKSGKIAGAALDVYEEEENTFFHDWSQSILQDDILARLLTFPNVIITSHQAFLTHEALYNIAQTTLESVQEFSQTSKVAAFKIVSK